MIPDPPPCDPDPPPMQLRADLAVSVSGQESNPSLVFIGKYNRSWSRGVEIRPPPLPDRKASDPQLFMDRLNNNQFSEIMSIFSGLVLHARLIFLIKIFAKLHACIGTAQNCRVFRLASTLDASIRGIQVKNPPPCFRFGTNKGGDSYLNTQIFFGLRPIKPKISKSLKGFK